VADAPAAHRGFLQKFSGASAQQAESGFGIPTPCGTIDMTTPEGFVARFGVKPPETARGPRLAAIRFAVADASLLQDLPELAGIAGLYQGNGAVVGAEDAMGAVLVFEASR